MTRGVERLRLSGLETDWRLTGDWRLETRESQQRMPVVGGLGSGRLVPEQKGDAQMQRCTMQVEKSLVGRPNSDRPQTRIKLYT